jgi:succinoglycan biosynthesis protein ExoA
LPTVSVIVPCYNEEGTIRFLLEALYQQTFPRPDLEVIIADGMSADRSRSEILLFSQSHPDLCVQIVDNHKRTIPSGLNLAIRAAQGEYIVRLDAHSIPCPNYIELSVKALVEGQGDNVGGVWEIRPALPGWVARSIAAAAAHPLGAGDAHYRYTNRVQLVDTVPFGAFRKSLIEQIGGFDESLLSNEDYEFNVRVRQSGGRVWLNPAIRSVYFARATFGKLAHQYWRYGYWKGRMLRRYPDTLRWRQAVPPVFAATLVVLGLVAVWAPLARVALGVELSLYVTLLILAAGRQAVKRSDPFLLLGMPAAISIMHLAWGTALIYSIFTGFFVEITGRIKRSKMLVSR